MYYLVLVDDGSSCYPCGVNLGYEHCCSSRGDRAKLVNGEEGWGGCNRHGERWGQRGGSIAGPHGEEAGGCEARIEHGDGQNPSRVGQNRARGRSGCTGRS